MNVEILSIREPFKSNGAWTNVACLDIRIEAQGICITIRNTLIKQKEDAIIAALPSVQIDGSWTPILSFGQEQDKSLKKAVVSAYRERVAELAAQAPEEPPEEPQARSPYEIPF